MKMTTFRIRSELARAGAAVACFAAAAPALADSSPTATVTIGRVDVIRRAADQNPQVFSARAETARYEALQNQVFAARFPKIEATVGVATSLQAELENRRNAESRRASYDDFAFDQLSAAFIGRITATQALYTFGKIDLRGEAADHGLRASKAQVRMTQADIALEAAEIYEGLLYARAVLLFVDDLQGIAEKTLEQTEDLLDEGSPDVSEQDILRVKSAMGIAELGRTTALAGESSALEGLRSYLSLPKGAKILTADEYLDPISTEPSKVEDIIELALKNRPEFEALKQGIMGVEKLAEAQAADYFPNIFIAGLVTAAYTPGREIIQSRYVFDPLGHFVPAALIGAQWELQWDMAGQRAAEVRAEAMKLSSLLKWAEQGIPAEVNNIYQDVVRARRDLKQLAETVPLTKKWIIKASANYGIGLGSSRDVSDAVTNYVLLKTAELQAVYRLNVALAKLAKATGTLVSGESPLYPGRGSK